MKTSRREFIKISSLGIGGLALTGGSDFPLIVMSVFGNVPVGLMLTKRVK